MCKRTKSAALVPSPLYAGERVRLCLTNVPAELPPSPGIPGEGRGGGFSRESSKHRPHPNPPPEYREREQCIHETQPS